MKITIKYLKSYQSFGVFLGNKAVGPSDFITDAAAVTWAQKKFRRATVVVKNFYLPAAARKRRSELHAVFGSK